MLHICWAVSGEEVRCFSADEIEDQTVKELKRELASYLGIPRFRQRWFGVDWSHIGDEDSIQNMEKVQLLY